MAREKSGLGNYLIPWLVLRLGTCEVSFGADFRERYRIKKEYGKLVEFLISGLFRFAQKLLGHNVWVHFWLEGQRLRTVMYWGRFLPTSRLSFRPYSKGSRVRDFRYASQEFSYHIGEVFNDIVTAIEYCVCMRCFNREGRVIVLDFNFRNRFATWMVLRFGTVYGILLDGHVA